MADAILASIDRVIHLARGVLDRLEGGDQLSSILPQGRLLAEARGDSKDVHWIDCEIYGLANVPFAERPRRSRQERLGCALFMELHAIEDVEKLNVQRMIAGRRPDPTRSGAVEHRSVGELERFVARDRESPPDYTGWSADQVFQSQVVQHERERVLDRVRSYLNKYVGAIWLGAQRERDNVELLGPDYRLVTEGLDALETGVGQELLAALGRLGSTNPAEWALSALGCRNVVLSLGRALFPVRAGTHYSVMLGKDLQLQGQKELNWLTAFIDLHWQKANDENKDKLQQLAELARTIYETGSRGKNKTALGHSQVQRLVVDTFRLVAGLKEITSLEPLAAAATTGG
jgi:hypothetical protein